MAVPTGKSQKHKRWWTSPKLIAFLCFVVVPFIGIQISKQRSICEKEELRILLIGKNWCGKEYNRKLNPKKKGICITHLTLILVSRNKPPTAQRTEYSRPVMSLHYILVIIGVLVAAAAICFQVFKEQAHSPGKAGKVQQEDAEELRILLVGKTGVGKSATGNTILRKDAFVSELTPSSVTTECKKADGYVHGRKVVVIDSPGLFDTQLSGDEVVDRIKMCIPLSAPGLHVFVVVIKLGRFTEEEEMTVKIIQNMFGRECYNYTMALFTHGDELNGKNIHQFIRNSTKLLDFIKKCRGGYHVFNNKDEDPKQVMQLLEQIDKMVTRNGGEYYTTEMLQEAERVIEEEKQRILKENEAQRKKEIDELTAVFIGGALQEEIKKKQEEHERKARKQAEESDTFFERIGKFFSAIVRKIKSFL